MGHFPMQGLRVGRSKHHLDFEASRPSSCQARMSASSNPIVPSIGSVTGPRARVPSGAGMSGARTKFGRRSACHCGISREHGVGGSDDAGPTRGLVLVAHPTSSVKPTARPIVRMPRFWHPCAER